MDSPCTWLKALESVAIIVAAVGALVGIDAWRREIRGRRRFELAEEVLALFYEARDRIAFMRSIFGTEGEGSSRQANPNELPETKQALDRAYVLFERYQSSQQTFSRLHALRYRFMSVFDPSSGKPFDDLRVVLNELFVAARMLGLLWDPSKQHFRTEVDRQRHEAHLTQYLPVFWAMTTEKDVIAERVDGIIAQIEGICGPILGR